MSHLFPPLFVVEEDQLMNVFINEAVSLGINLGEAERLFKILPASVKSAPAVKFRLGLSDWRYRFGKPFHTGGSRGFGIPHQAPLVVSLVRATMAADRVLTLSQLRRSWWQQLDKPAKHLDAIVEMLAVSNVTTDYSLTYEQTGLGVGSQRIDWLLKTAEEGDFLLEVKNRPGQTAQELTRIQISPKTTDTHMVTDEPITDFNMLFKSTASKFLPISSSSYTQGVLVFLGIKVPVARFDEYYRNHLQSSFHFVAFGKEDKEVGIRVNVLATSSEITDRVLSTFGWHNGADLTY